MFGNELLRVECCVIFVCLSSFSCVTIYISKRFIAIWSSCFGLVEAVSVIFFFFNKELLLMLIDMFGQFYKITELIPPAIVCYLKKKIDSLKKVILLCLLRRCR